MHASDNLSQLPVGYRRQDRIRHAFPATLAAAVPLAAAVAVVWLGQPGRLSLLGDEPHYLVMADARTANGYDFNVRFNTPIVFPISWDHAHVSGLAGRVNVLEQRGFSAFVVLATTSAIFCPPATGSIQVVVRPGPFRIDHDQKFNATTNVQHTFAKALGGWIALVWRYDSGLVPSALTDITSALALTADQQATSPHPSEVAHPRALVRRG